MGCLDVPLGCVDLPWSPKQHCPMQLNHNNYIYLLSNATATSRVSRVIGFMGVPLAGALKPWWCLVMPGLNSWPELLSACKTAGGRGWPGQAKKQKLLFAGGGSCCAADTRCPGPLILGGPPLTGALQLLFPVQLLVKCQRVFACHASAAVCQTKHLLAFHKQLHRKKGLECSASCRCSWIQTSVSEGQRCSACACGSILQNNGGPYESKVQSR